MNSRGELPCPSWLWSMPFALALLLLLKLAESQELGRTAAAAREGATTGRRNGFCSPPLFVFGASMMDTGENVAAQPYSSSCENPPYGRDYWGHPANRYSNGRVITDHLCQELGLPFLHPYLEFGVTDFMQGVNFASSGSTAISARRCGGPSQTGFSLKVQVNQFQIFKNRSLQQATIGGVSTFPTLDEFRAGFYILEVGDNDFMKLKHGYGNEMLFFRDLLSAIKRAIETLYSEGARNIIVFNVMPIGCHPESAGVKHPKQLDEFGCFALANEDVSRYNRLLQTFVDKLRPRLPEANLVLFDFNRVYKDAFSKPSQYGLTNVHASCCGAGGGKYNYIKNATCGTTIPANVHLVEVCDNPTEYIYWDNLHPTDSFAGHITSALVSGTHSTPAFRLTNSCLVHKS